MSELMTLTYAAHVTELPANVLLHVAEKRNWPVEEPVEGCFLIGEQVLSLPKLRLIKCEPEPEPDSSDGWPNWPTPA